MVFKSSIKSVMPKGGNTQRKSNGQRVVRQNRPRKQPSAVASIARGLTGVAQQFIPGLGPIASGVGKLFGFGAYTTAEADKILAARVPTMNATLDQGVRVSHHEFIGDVLSTSDFAVLKYPLNPGVSGTFPWLSSVAAAFQEYELNGCVFYFKSTSANALNSTNTALGQVIGAVQYNPYLASPASKIEMLGLSSAADGKPSESNLYPVECKADMVLMRSKLVRSGAVVDDLAKYDHGNFFLGTNGSQAIATVGELHIVYDITLKKPKLFASGASPAWYYHESSTENKSSGAAPFTGTSYVFQNSLGVTRGIAADGKYMFTIPEQYVVAGTKYHIIMTWGGTAASVVKPVLSSTNFTWANDIMNNTQGASGWDAPSSGSSNRYTLIHTGYASKSHVKIEFFVGISGTLPTDAAWDVCITEAE